MAPDAAGSVYFNALNCVFKLDLRGALTRVAGTSSGGYSGDGGPAINAQVATDNGDGGEQAGAAISRETEGAIAGNRRDASTKAQLSYLSGIAADAAGNLFIADTGSSRIRRVSPDGIISTVAGDGTQGYSGDGGPATMA